MVVLGWRSAPHLLGCLDALRASAPAVEHEVVVSLNAPTGGLEEAVRGWSPELLVTSSAVNLGYAGGSIAAGAFDLEDLARHPGLHAEARDCYILCLVCRKPS